MIDINDINVEDIALLARKISFLRNEKKLAVLMTIHENDCSAKEISQKTGLSTGEVNHALNELKREYLILLRSRKFSYSLTELGKNLAEIVEILARLGQSKSIIDFERMKLE